MKRQPCAIRHNTDLWLSSVFESASSSVSSFQELNLDLVNFPRPVVVKEVRVIPLGTRVQADVPGGVRLG